VKETAVCITTYNEADTIGPLVLTLRALGLTSIYVIDDHSQDGTARLAALAGAVSIVNHERAGIGPSLMNAWRLAYNAGYSRFAQMDAGGSHNPGHLLTMLDVDADLVIGSRFAGDAIYYGRPWRAFLSRLAAVACNAAQPGMRVSDWTSGMRVFSRRAIEALLGYSYRATMHSWNIEVLARAGEAGLSIVESPITYRAGRSSFNLKVAGEAFSTWLHIINHIGYANRSRLHIPQ
jgi:dolichol-phosphate mannosyltransferase